MIIDLAHASSILAMTENELMFSVQSGSLEAIINQDNMTWEFDIDQVLSLKKELDQENLMSDNPE